MWNTSSASPAYCDGTVWHKFPKGEEIESWVAPSQFPVLANPTPHSTDYFGYAVAMSGNLAVVGVYQDESDGTTGILNAGRAYVFDADTGALVATLNNPTPHASDFFGYAVAIDGNTVVVGAYQDESDGEAGTSAAGRAYVFNATTGALITALNNPSPNASDHFGYSVGVSGNLAVVGAWNDEIDGGAGTTSDGRAYVFNATTGALVTALNNPSSVTTGDQFGESVAISGNVVVVGTSSDEADGGSTTSLAGRAYLFNATTGAFIAPINNPSPNGSDYFGKVVAIDGNRVVVGAYYDESDGNAGVFNAGRAYVFDATTGVLVVALDNPTPHASDYFGSSVAIDGGMVLVGAYNDEHDGESGVSAAGRAYLFDANTGALITALENPTPHSTDTFGNAVGLSGSYALVGSWQDESDGGAGVSAAGRAFIFRPGVVSSWDPSLLQSAALDNPVPTTSDYFGYAVAIDGDMVAVGAYSDEADGGASISGAGRAYVHNAETGAWIASLDNPVPTTLDYFGNAIDISGNLVVVGAWQDEADGAASISAAGRAYVFNATTGALITALDNPSPNATDNFGYSVAIDGNVAVVGAHMDESDGGAGTSAAGRAYVFNATTGALVTALNNPSPNTSDNFGNAVAISGNLVLVGAYMDESDGGAGVSAAGRAYVFNATTGALVATLNNPSPTATDNFGNSVALDGTVAVVGAMFDEADGGASVSSAGRAYVFDATTGVLVTALNNPNSTASDEFGSSVGVSGNLAVVGAWQDESDGSAGVSAAGRAYVFDTTTGLLVGVLNNPSPNTTDNFGWAVAIDDGIAAVGAHLDESDGGAGTSAAGRVYTFWPDGGCSNPDGVAGDVTYNTTHNVLQYCDGIGWYAAGAAGNGGGGCSAPSGVAGDLVFNTTHNVLQYCEGDAWIKIGN
ncbi:hypothetical protein [Micavibrio aeruginosavorus]|uniref:hypothetical protein n=1 Tax=Micavibrio aeruginosavorus TaxID=349221 RepID=UPI003F4AE95B